MDGYEYPHWTEFWVPEEEGGVRFTVVVYCKGGEKGAQEGLPMPPNLTARALCIPCGSKVDLLERFLLATVRLIFCFSFEPCA